MADDEDDLYDQSCRDWAEINALFDKQQTWPDGRGSELYRHDPQALRAFWMKHGCVQCWLETVTDWGNHLPDYRHSGRRVYVANVDDSTKWLRKRVKYWNDPGTRLPGRFQCRSHAKPLKCAVAIQTKSGVGGGIGIGHLSWGYEVPKAWRHFRPHNSRTGPWQIGEHALFAGFDRNQTIRPDSDPGFQENADGPSIWEDVFDEYKLLLASEADFEEALLRSGEVAHWYYLVADFNCQTAVHYVLGGFRADGLPPGCYPFEINYYYWIVGGRYSLTGRPLGTLPDPTPQPAPPPRPPRSSSRPQATGTPEQDA